MIIYEPLNKLNVGWTSWWFVRICSLRMQNLYIQLSGYMKPLPVDHTACMHYELLYGIYVRLRFGRFATTSWLPNESSHYVIPRMTQTQEYIGESTSGFEFLPQLL